MNASVGPVIDTHEISRFYGRRKHRIRAVSEMSFTVERGTIFGLIGPDGSGKTSIIQILAGVLAPDEGSARVDGIDVGRDPETVKQRVGYMPQGLGANLYDNLTVNENIEFFRDLRQLPEAEYRRNRDQLLAMTRLTPFLDRRAADLSGGMRQKLALICTLIHLPDVLLLDEPTTGVDPISRQDFWQIIGRIVDERQATVLLSTSYMDEAERCNRIALLHAGIVMAEGAPEVLRSQSTGHYARIKAKPQDEALHLLRTRPQVTSTEVFGEDIHIRFDGDLRNIESEIASHGIIIEDMSPQEPDLEDVFLELLSDKEERNGSIQFRQPKNNSHPISVVCDRVSRRFGGFIAVNNVSLQVHRGEIFGLLGPNGAGKTTLIKMMCGLLEPTSGSISTAGVDVHNERARASQEIGYMSQRFSLYRDLTVRQNLRLYGDLYGVEESNLADMAARLGLKSFEQRLAGDLPAGVRQRLSLVCAILHNPPIVFLDEPTSGVDPQARRVFWDLIYSLSRESGVTVLVSTHYMDEAIHCDRLGLMDQGQLIAVGSPADLKRASEKRSGSVIEVRTPDLRAAHDVIFSRFPNAVFFGGSIHVRSLNPPSDQALIHGLLTRIGIGGAETELVPLSMDETFIDFIQSEAAHHA
jgi:ABC-2 type transport system ATP-binding protein